MINEIVAKSYFFQTVLLKFTSKSKDVVKLAFLIHQIYKHVDYK